MSSNSTKPAFYLVLSFFCFFCFCFAASGAMGAEAAAAAAAALDSSSRDFRFVNKCNATLWVGSLGSTLINGGGWPVGPGSTVTVSAPPGWHGRFWARTGCRFDRSGKGRCETGDCGGLAKCSGAGGQPPATLAEFSLGPPKDFYDVSLVDGYNVQVSVRPVVVGGRGGQITREQDELQWSGTGPPRRSSHPDAYVCHPAGCETDLNKFCPASLRVNGARHHHGGGVVACRSACNAFSKDKYCCTGAFASPATCHASAFSRIFKRACPHAYTYAYDDPTSIFTCDSPKAYSIYLC